VPAFAGMTAFDAMTAFAGMTAFDGMTVDVANDDQNITIKA
jgi:hypothetical protein